MAKRGLVIAGAEVLVLGLTFKENCPDLRNTRVRQLVEALQTAMSGVMNKMHRNRQTASRDPANQWLVLEPNRIDKQYWKDL